MPTFKALFFNEVIASWLQEGSHKQRVARTVTACKHLNMLTHFTFDCFGGNPTHTINFRNGIKKLR